MSSSASSAGPSSSSAQPTSATSVATTTQASTTVAASTSNPATSDSATPVTTPQSTPQQSSSPVAQTTRSAQSSAASNSPSSTASAVTSSSSFTSQVATTYVTTDPSGSVVFITSTVPEVFTTSITTGSSGGGPNHTGVIVGAVVGGVAGIAIIVLLLFCIRRRAQRDDFDGNFDPDRVVGHGDVGGTLPNVNLAEEVTPFPQSQSYYPDQGNANMRQLGKSPYLSVPSSQDSDSQFYPPGPRVVGASIIDAQPQPFVHSGAGSPPPGSYIPPINMYGTGPADWHNPRPGVSPPPSTTSNTTTSTRATKEREAMARIGQGLATQPETAEGSGEVVVHQDAGRAPIEEPAPPREIPPAYESIQRD